jgi:hypothetical protein
VEAASANPTQELATLHRSLNSLVEMFTTIGMAALVRISMADSIIATKVSFC